MALEPIPGFEGRYSISKEGRIFSHLRNRFIKDFPTPKGYRNVVLVRQDRKLISIHVHRLVCLTFLPNPENLPQVNHKDGNKTNNTLENLEWSDNSRNIKHAWDNGLFRPTPTRGEKSVHAKLTEDQVIEIRRLYSTGNYLQREIAVMFGVSREQCRDIINRKNWKHVQ